MKALLTTAFLFLITAGVSTSLHAKDVFIEWTGIEGAIQYELEVQQNGKVVFQKVTEERKWSGELKNGFYAYRLRAYDKVKRPGTWSELKVLVVMPGSPKPLSPRDGETTYQFAERGPFQVKWKPGEGTREYRLEVKHGEKTVYEKVVSGTHAFIPGLNPGVYSWHVSAVVEADARAPASYTGKIWQSEIQSVESFHVERTSLEKPAVIGPGGRTISSHSHPTAFRWHPVEGAEAYEVQIHKTNDSRSKSFTVTEPEVTLNLPREGEFTWEVRALGNVEERETKKIAGALGPKSITDFKIDTDEMAGAGQGSISLSAALLSANYHINSPLIGIQGDSAAKGFGQRLDGDYWLSDRWGLGLGFERIDTHLTDIQSSNSDTSFSRTGADISARYRIRLSESRYGFVLVPRLGLEMRQYADVRSNMTGANQGSSGGGAPEILTFVKPSTYGVHAGGDLRYTLNRFFDCELRLHYYYPITVSGVDGGLSGGDNIRNLTAVFQVNYSFATNWAVGAGAIYDLRSISYASGLSPDQVHPKIGNSNSQGSTGTDQEVFADGHSFFAGLLFRF